MGSWGAECPGLSVASTCGDRSTNLGNEMYEKLTSISGYVCNGFFSIGEDGLETRKMACICELFGSYSDLERRFHTIRDYLCTKDAKFKSGQPST